MTVAGTPGRSRTAWLAHPSVAPLATLGAGLAGAAYLWRTNPHEDGQLLPPCPFHWATGLLCPACGGTRMTYDAMHGDLVAAFHDNAVLLLLGVPLAAWLGGRWLSEGLRGRRYRPRFRRPAVAAILAVAVAWVLLRNAVG
ncbi:DUF2752 domain-containing protein [Streptomyces sp. 4N509B]|uniref:DUF2752 domain-containing protein n=1 Tax=Streptomyces sp. 4N509B TaxID=3457413 RepID=UPI003FCF4EFE